MLECGDKQRKENQEDFIYDRKDIMIATNAFGMGINKSNIRFIIHYNMPATIENYYQEAGRAGRDGEKAECILLFSRNDIITNKFLIEQSDNEKEKAKEYQKLNNIVDYCNTDKCLRKYILEYFGEKVEYNECKSCGNCNNYTEKTDITLDTQKIMSCIKRMNERFGSMLVTDVLKGANTAKIKQLGLNKLSTYGIMKEQSKEYIREIISFLISDGYIISIGDKYPTLKLSNKATEVLFNNEKVIIKRKMIKKEVIQNNFNKELFIILKNLRTEIAIRNDLPPFVIFSDASLIDMCKNYPINKQDMLKIVGVGSLKLEKYGELFLEKIIEYVDRNNIILKNKGSNREGKKQDTYICTFELYKNGNTINEIALQRNLTKQTIENHLLKCIEKGLDINIEKNINTKYKSQILNVINKIGIEKLKPIKEALPEEVTYFDIKYYILKRNIS